MNLFTPEQIKELSVIFGIEPVNPESIAKVRDGSIRKGDSVWWWGEYGPQFVKSDDSSHWENIQSCPEVYSLKRPRIQYID